MEIQVETRPRFPTIGDSDTEIQYTNAASTTTLDSPELKLRQRRRLGTQHTQHTDESFTFLDLPDNEIEEHKMTQNYMFGFKKWKSHLTVRPLQERSDVVKELYQEPKQIKTAAVSTTTVGNVLYIFLIGWILALVYSIMAVIMFLTIIGKDHGFFCFKLARYFLWPFGYFVQEHTAYQLEDSNEENGEIGNNIMRSSEDDEMNESTPLNARPNYVKIKTTNYWKRPSTYVWLLLGVPLLFIVHALIIFLTWITVILIPVAKLNMLAVKRLLLMPPEKLYIDKSSTSTTKHSKGPSEVIMCSYEAVNLYYYKYTVDGMNVILVNLLVFVVLTLLIGFLDTEKHAFDTNLKFVMGLVAIVPLAYYIGMSIASISAQSTHAIGAFLNATFGSIVEIILYVSALLKYEQGTNKGPCYEDLVQSALTGTLLVTMLFVPGICMIVGGLKYSEQRFNMKSAAVSASLLFISIAGAFTPTIFTKTYGSWTCQNCSSSANSTVCLNCRTSLAPNDSFYKEKVLPLIYVCVSLSLFAYVMGLVFTLKTHSHILEEHLHAIQHPQASKSIVHWGRIKSAVILLLSVVAMSLCAEVVVQNMEPILTESGMSEKFIGVTIIAMVPDIPEIVNGIQFAMKNNISLSIDIGSSVAVQVCLLQIPLLVLANAIYPLHFHMVFNDLHLWSVIISVIIMNFVFNDGKANYFQGITLCVVYVIMLSMYFFAPDETNNRGCLDDDI